MKINKKTILLYIGVYLLGIVTSNLSFLIAHKTKNTSVVTTNPQTMVPLNTSNSSLDTKLEKITEDLAVLKAQQKLLNKTLGVSTTSAEVAELNTELLESTALSTSPGKIKILKSSTPRLNVYLEPDTSSKIVAQIVYGQEYTYQSREGNWYKLDRPAGYVNSENVINIK
ncbi:MAG: SH3 domain-containing protein [Patescibacteria group bacterium]